MAWSLPAARLTTTSRGLLSTALSNPLVFQALEGSCSDPQRAGHAEGGGVLSWLLCASHPSATAISRAAPQARQFCNNNNNNNNNNSNNSSNNNSNNNNSSNNSNATYQDLYKYLESLQQSGAQTGGRGEAQGLDGSGFSSRTWGRNADQTGARGNIVPGRLHPRRRAKSQIQPQFLADALWAYAKVRHHNDQLFQVSARYLLKCNLYSLSIGAATKLAWAYAVMQIHHERLFMELANVLLRKSGDLSEKHIADALWAFGEVRHRDSELFRQLAGVCVQLQSRLSLEQMARIVWAYAEVKQPQPQLFQAFSQPLQAGATQLSNRQLADVAWAYTSLGFKDPVLDTIATVASDKAAEFKPLEWDRLMAAFTMVSHPAMAALIAKGPASKGEAVLVAGPRGVTSVAEAAQAVASSN